MRTSAGKSAGLEVTIASAGADRRGQDVAIIGIGERQARDEFFMGCHDRVKGRPVHEVAGPLQLLQTAESIKEVRELIQLLKAERQQKRSDVPGRK